MFSRLKYIVWLFVCFSIACAKLPAPYKNAIYAPDPMIHWDEGYYFSASFSKPLLGVGDQLHSANLTAFTPRNCWDGGFGLNVQHIGCTYYNQQKAVIFGRTPRIPVGPMAMSLWVAPGVERIGYVASSFYRFDLSDPVFSGKTSKFAPLVDAGFVAKGKKFLFSAWANNILQPNLSLTNDPEGKEPLSGESYIAIEVYDNLTPWVGAKYDGVSQKIVPLAGLTYNYNGWNFSGGYRANAVWLDISVPIISQRFWSNYSVGYNVANSEIARAMLTSHLLGIEVVFPKAVKRAPLLPNFVLEAGELHDQMPLDTTHLSVAVLNKSSVESRPTQVTFFAVSPTETTLVGTEDVPAMQPNSEFLAEYKWLPTHPGTYSLYFTVDDDGQHFPGLKGQIDETSEEDNRLIHEFSVLGELNATISTLLQILTIPSVTFLREEQPIVPLVFFEPRSSNIPARYDTVLSVIAQRLQTNPDVILELRGYYDVETDGENEFSIAQERMETVKKQLTKMGTPPSSIIMLSSAEYDAGKERIPVIRANIPQRDKKMVQDENRRVEMIARFENTKHLVYEFPLSLADAEIPLQNRNVIDTLANKIGGILCSDHSSIVLVEGVVPRGGDAVDFLQKTSMVRDYLIPRLQVFCPLERIPVAIAGEGTEGLVRIWLSAEGIVFKPVENVEAAKEFIIPDDMNKNLLVISVSAPELIRNFSIFAYNEDKGDTVRFFASGDGPPPAQIVWDWRDDDGNLIDPRGTYRAVMLLEDRFGHIYRFQSEPMWVVVEELEYRLESSIVVQFSFDETVSESKYLESRLEEFARQIVDKALLPGNQIIVRLTGHTDIIGTETRNQRLSEERAEKELEKFRDLLQFVLRLDNLSDLNEWLRKNKVTLESRGVRDKEPYEIERYRNGKFEKVLVGDNVTPEGRSVNRRVVIEIEERMTK